jgi:hypothetical protein
MSSVIRLDTAMLSRLLPQAQARAGACIPGGGRPGERASPERHNVGATWCTQYYFARPGVRRPSSD